MSNRITQTDAIQSGKRSGIAIPQERMTYGEDYTADDFEDNDLISKAAVIELVGDVPVAPVLADGVITPGVIEIDVDSLATFTTQFSYRLGGVGFDPTQPDLQLDAPDATNSRIDIIYGKDDGTYDFVTGVAAPTYEAPLPPSGTILLAKILRRANGTNVISIIGTTGYVEQILATIYGDTFHKYGSNIFLDSAEGLDDTGDIIGRKKTGANFEETWRLYKGLNGDDRVIIRFNGDPNDEYPIALKKQAIKTQADRVIDNDYILFTDSNDVQIPDDAVYSVEMINSDDVGFNMDAQIQRMPGGERRIFGIPTEGDFTITINFI